MPRRLLNLLTALSLLMCVAVVLWVSHAYLDAGRVIHTEIVVPDGFRGTAVVKFSERGGVWVKPVRGRYTFDIPESDVLTTRNENPQFSSRHESARYRSGQPLPIAYLTDERTLPPAGATAVWPLLLDGDDAGFFVGTLAERQAMRRQWPETAGSEEGDGPVKGGPTDSPADGTDPTRR